MEHRKGRPLTLRQKRQHTAKFFEEPRFCEHCRAMVPRESGNYVNLPSGRRVWMCIKHGESA